MDGIDGSRNASLWIVHVAHGTCGRGTRGDAATATPATLSNKLADVFNTGLQSRIPQHTCKILQLFMNGPLLFNDWLHHGHKGAVLFANHLADLPDLLACGLCAQPAIAISAWKGNAHSLSNEHGSILTVRHVPAAVALIQAANIELKPGLRRYQQSTVRFEFVSAW